MTRTDWVTLCLIVLCLTPYGCKDSVSVSHKPDVPLASLSVTPATLQPAFSSDTTSFTAEAPTAATSVTITATPKDSTVTVSIDGTVTTQRSITLDHPGSTKTIPIVLTTQNGTESTYAVHVTRLLSSDSNLKTLAVAEGPLSHPFDAAKLDYAVEVATDVPSVTVTATKSDPEAVISGNLTHEGAATIQLDSPGTTKTVSITVTAPNQTSKTYRITVHRAASSNNNLSALRVQAGAVDQTLSPAFSPGESTYSVDVGTKVTSVTVTATKADPLATISGGVPNEGQATIQLDGPGTQKTISLHVAAQDGSIKTYTVTVYRTASSNNNLSALRVQVGAVDQTLFPAFSPGEIHYGVEVGTKVASVTVTATKADTNAVISGDVPNEGQATIQLSGPGNPTTVRITVTAQDGNNKFYTVTVNRAAPSTNNNLSALSVTSGSLSPAFSAEQLAYTVDVPTGVVGVDISATKADVDAVMSGSVSAGAGQATGQASITLGMPGTAATVSITVTAPNGIPKPYTITINRRASNDSTLSALSVSAGSLTPGFAPGIVNYTVTAGLLDGSVTLTATKTDPNAVMASLGSVIAAAGTPTGHITVFPGLGVSTSVDITGIAQDGITKTKYIVTVTRGLF